MVALCIALATNARAADETPEPGASAVLQYTELVPTASGPKAPGIGESTTTPLPEDTASALGVTSDARARVLAELATSSAYGAPSSVAPAGSSAPLDQSSFDESVRSTAETAVGDTRLIALLVLMLATLAVAAGLAIGKRVD